MMVWINYISIKFETSYIDSKNGLAKRYLEMAKKGYLLLRCLKIGLIEQMSLGQVN
jgi:hypothetical protein